MERGRLRLIALLLCAVFLLVGCGGSGGETTTENGEAAPARDTLIVGMDREPAARSCAEQSRHHCCHDFQQHLRHPSP